MKKETIWHDEAVKVKMNNKKPNSQEIKQNYKWFIEHCERFKKDTIPYKHFKKEFIETWEFNQKPEEQARLSNMKKALNETIGLLK